MPDIKTTKNIALIGMGNIGRRHLQSCLELSKDAYTLHIVDKHEPCLAQGLDMNAHHTHDIKAHHDTNTLPAHLDLAIIATQANIRAPLIKQLLSKQRIKHFLLEKVLFQKLAEYAEIEELLKLHNIPTWVNCPRRLWPAYKELKNYLQSQTVTSIEIIGKDWDLGCNGIHYIDCMAYLLDSSSYQITESYFPYAPKESKRPGNYFIDGKVKGVFDTQPSCTFSLDSLEGPSDHKTITIYDHAKVLAVIHERATHIDIMIPNIERAAHPIPYQSQLTSGVVEDILHNQSCGLSDYETSKSLHLPLLTKIYEYTRQYHPSLDYCPVT